MDIIETPAREVKTRSALISPIPAENQLSNNKNRYTSLTITEGIIL